MGHKQRCPKSKAYPKEQLYKPRQRLICRFPLMQPTSGSGEKAEAVSCVPALRLSLRPRNSHEPRPRHHFQHPLLPMSDHQYPNRIHHLQFHHLLSCSRFQPLLRPLHRLPLHQIPIHRYLDSPHPHPAPVHVLCYLPHGRTHHQSPPHQNPSRQKKSWTLSLRPPVEELDCPQRLGCIFLILF